MRRQFMVSLAGKTNQNCLVLPTRQSQMELGRGVELKRKSFWADFFTLIFMFIHLTQHIPARHTHTNHEVNTTHVTQPSPNENVSTRKRPRLLIPHEGKLFLHPQLQLIYELK